MNIQKIKIVMEYARKNNIPVLILARKQDEIFLQDLYNVPTDSGERIKVWKQIMLRDFPKKCIILRKDGATVVPPGQDFLESLKEI